MSPILGLVLAGIAAYGLFTSGRVETDGPDAQGYKWEKRLPALPVSGVHLITDGNLAMNCGVEYHAESCYRRNEQAGTCDIYLPLDAAMWKEDHERRHCDGWVHPGGLKW